MSQKIYVPTRSLTFTANTAIHATKLGLLKGAQKAATKVNPVLLVIEAGISVANATQSYFELKKAKVTRDGLTDYIPKVEERLKIERKELIEKARLLKAELDLKKDKQSEITEFVILTVQFYGDAVIEFEKMKELDLINEVELDRKEEELEKQWRSFQKALRVYAETII